MWARVKDFLLNALIACVMVAVYGAALWFVGNRLYDAFFVDHPPRKDPLAWCDDLEREELRDYPECFFPETPDDSEFLPAPYR